VSDVIGTYVDGPSDESVFTNFGTIIGADGRTVTGGKAGHATGDRTDPGAGHGVGLPVDFGARIADQATPARAMLAAQARNQPLRQRDPR
jgi:hypothetical protein